MSSGAWHRAAAWQLDAQLCRTWPSEQPQPGYISAIVHLRPILRVMLKVYLSFVVQDIVSFPNRPSLNDLANPAFRSSGVDTVPDLPGAC